MDETPKNGSEGAEVPEAPIERSVQIVPMPVAVLTEPCECGELLAFNDPQAVQAFTSGHAAVVECPKCKTRLRLTLSRILVAPNRAERRAQEAQGKKPGLVRIK